MGYSEESAYLELLDRIALRVYGKEYSRLCSDRKRTVETLERTGDF